MIAKSLGWPIVLAPANDSGGLGIVEGIEDGLSVLAVTGLGIWVAGSASRLPALAERIPDYVNEVTIFADTDDDGMRHAHELKRRLRARGLFAAIVEPPEKSR
jgi:5S rRNA maturation endonuclease (ribonuclease M5)